jgi:CBS domain-containing protein
MAIFVGSWIFFTYITSGTAVPCGIFLPCMVIGCGLGHIYHPLHLYLCTFFPDSLSNEPINSETVSILGAAAVLSGSTRMTYCLAVIMLETTANVDLFLPVIFTLFCSYGAGFLLNSRSIYKGALRSKNIPIINKEVPKVNRNKKAFEIMTGEPARLQFVTTVEQVWHYLKNSKYNGYPVVNSDGQPIGIIDRDALVTLIEKKGWYRSSQGIQIESVEITSGSRGYLSEKLLNVPLGKSII